MAGTGETWFNAQANSILALSLLTTNLREPTMEAIDTMRLDLYGGQGTIGAAKAALTYVGSQQLAVEVDKVAFDGQGLRLRTYTDVIWTDIPYPDSAATTFYVGAKACLRPSHVTANTADGIPVYDEFVEDVGDLGAPDLVTDTGVGLSFRVDSFVTIWNDVNRGKRVVVYKTIPATGASTAIYEGSAVPSGGHIVLTVPHYLGQAVGNRSTTASDYRVVVRGPRVSTVPLSTDYWRIGSVNTGVTAISGQTLLLPYTTWTAAFLVEHDSAGAHLAIHGETISLDGALVKVHTEAVDAADSNAAPAAEFLGSALAKLELWASDAYGGKVRFPNANSGGTRAGAVLDVTASGAGAVNLYITNDRSGTDYAQIIYDGLLKWNATKSGNNWAIQCDLGTDQTLTISNIGAGKASIDVEGDVDVGRDLGVSGVSLFGGDITIQGEILYWTYPNRYWRQNVALAYRLEPAGGTIFADTAATPPHVRSAVAATPVTFQIPFPVMDYDAQGLELDEVAVTYKLNNAGDTLTGQLWKQVGTAAPVALGAAMTASNHGGAWDTAGMTLTAIGETLNPATVYWIELVLSPAGFTTDAEVCSVIYTLLQAKVS